MSKLMAKLPEFYDIYKKWVSSNPQMIGDVESTVKWVSYFIVGRIDSSAAVSELVYCLSNLLVLLNDRIIKKSIDNIESNEENGTIDQIKLFLTTLEYCEVFIEISAKRTWGTKAKWFFITVIQIIKCIGRLILATHFREAIIQSPAIPALDRKNINSTTNLSSYDGFDKNSSFTFTLKRSGRVVRRVEGAPPTSLRNWKLLSEETNNTLQIKNNLNLTAELLYIFKPIVHLGSIATFGDKSWRSWGLPLFIDIYSLHVYYKRREQLNKQQKTELSRRCVTLLLYLLRSPFYDRHSKDKINALLNSIARNIPLAKAVCNPLMQYIPNWQSTYAYTWSS